MSARPRRQGDADIVAGTARVLSRTGPARLTLAAVAAEVGLAPATLIQRFGSKRGLLLAFAEQATASVAREFEAAGMARQSPLDTLFDVLVGMTRDVSTPEALANNLAFLEMDLADPDFHRHAHRHARAMRVGIQALLDAAVEQGELIPCDTARLARAVQVTYNGALVTWAIEREGTIAQWLRDDLDLLLQTFRTAAPRSSPGS